ncbi:uncharacterized protein LOC143285754 [Babylonia areolata]|uniref:uncharacterized protein LOC143285754 n=1 Tax=Babylonia areolata TaxID=304850 RepID=UPI003FD4F315
MADNWRGGREQKGKAKMKQKFAGTISLLLVLIYFLTFTTEEFTDVTSSQESSKMAGEQRNSTSAKPPPPTTATSDFPIQLARAGDVFDADILATHTAQQRQEQVSMKHSKTGGQKARQRQFKTERSGARLVLKSDRTNRTRRFEQLVSQRSVLTDEDSDPEHFKLVVPFETRDHISREVRRGALSSHSDKENIQIETGTKTLHGAKYSDTTRHESLRVARTKTLHGAKLGDEERRESVHADRSHSRGVFSTCCGEANSSPKTGAHPGAVLGGGTLGHEKSAAVFRSPRSASSHVHHDETDFTEYLTIGNEQFAECGGNRYGQPQRIRYGYVSVRNTVSQDTWCSLSFLGPPGTVFKVSLRYLHPPSALIVTANDLYARYRRIIFTSKADNWPNFHPKHGKEKTIPLVGYSSSNQMSLYVVANFTDLQKNVALDIFFQSMTAADAEKEKPALEKVVLDHSLGYIQTPGNDTYPPNMDSCLTLTAPENHVIMTSFVFLDLAVLTDGDRISCHDETGKPLDHVELFLSPNCSTDAKKVRNVCNKPAPEAEIHNSNTLSVFFYSDDELETGGFKMLYSFHPVDDRPQRLNNSQWNCSVPFWRKLILNFPCNLQWDCLDGEDELPCPYSINTPNTTCSEGLMALGGNCYLFKYAHWYDQLGYLRGLTWLDASHECNKRGLRLASLAREKEMNDIFSVLPYIQAVQTYVGLQLAFTTSPAM